MRKPLPTVPRVRKVSRPFKFQPYFQRLILMWLLILLVGLCMRNGDVVVGAMTALYWCTRRIMDPRSVE